MVVFVENCECDRGAAKITQIVLGLFSRNKGGGQNLILKIEK